MNVGDRIRKARKLRGLTGSQLGELLGVKHSVISQWETGARKNPRTDSIQRIASALDISLEWLLTGSGHMLNFPDEGEYIKCDPPAMRRLPVRGEIPGKVPLLEIHQVQEYDNCPDDITSHEHAFVLKVIDEEFGFMSPSLGTGDMAIIEPLAGTPPENKIVLISNGEELTLHTYYTDKEKGPMMLEPMGDQVVFDEAARKSITILGRLKGIHKPRIIKPD